MFKQLRRQIILTISTIGIAAFAVLFGALVYFNYLITEQDLRELLENSLDKAASSPYMRYNQRMNCPIIEYLDDGTVITYGFDSYSDSEMSAILSSTAQLSEERGKFPANSTVYYYATRVVSSPLGDTVVLVAVYDVSIIKSNLRSFATTIVIAFLCCVAIIVGASIPIADNILSPTIAAWNKQRDLITNASHELKTPLTIIDTNLRALCETVCVDEENKKWMDNISCQTKRMNTLVCEMLELARYDNGTPAARTSVNVSELIDGIMLGYEAAAFEKGIELTTDIEHSIVLETNEDLLSKIIYILADNALKYTKPNNNVLVRAYTEKKHCIISVKNTGVGIATENQEKIFDRFFREDSVRNQNGENSFGLGLSIARAACRNIGGEIRALSDGSSFVEFFVSLPK